MDQYDHKKIEKKWQEKWEHDGTYKTTDETSKEKCYVLDMFPYPSGEGLHVGHPKGYIATDVYARMKRMQGFNVLHPMGWDAFGLPAENYAIKTKTHPRDAVEKNVAHFKNQLQVIGFDYDWSREINTTDPEYYKWTQWIFLQLFKKGLAYESNEPINWCPSCKTGLANEDVERDGTCERCDTPVEKRPMRQWVLKITEYADRLLEDLDTLSKWPEHIKEQQRNWIGRSEGANVSWKVENSDVVLDTFTTTIDTIYGVTFVVISPEHPELQSIVSDEAKDAVSTYQKEVQNKSEIERTADGQEKTGIPTGVNVIHPLTGEKVPLWVADYVVMGYGTGVVMGVPAHDKRDNDFAQKNGFAVVQSIQNVEEQSFYYDDVDKKTVQGTIIDSGEFTGMPIIEGRKAIVAKLATENMAEHTIQYRIQDWVFSRQRYWGEPIPIIHCYKCGAVPVPEDQLPVELPDVEHYEPSGTGESPLATIDEWLNVNCPKCSGPAKRETNTMPQWAGSSWYWLRFMDPRNTNDLVGKDNEKHWGPVDVYVGGDHAVRHLIYARFWNKVLFDIGVVTDEEPFSRLEFLGFILAEDGRKMSKRWGNVINPNDVVSQHGADSFRTYEMFMGPFENTIAWSTNGLVGVQRFIERAWRLQERIQETSGQEVETELHRTIKKVDEDINAFKFNTAVAQMMILVNVIEKSGGISKQDYELFLKVLAPFAPHITEEIWHNMGHDTSIHHEKWPEYDEKKATTDDVTIVVQINGKVRGELAVSRGISQEDVEDDAKKLVQKWIHGDVKKVVFVENRLINFVL